jgi:uncharacterized protein YukE
MTKTKYRTVYKEIHPPEADRIAEAYQRAKKEVDQGLSSLKKTLSAMDGDWEGNQKMAFMDRARTGEIKTSQFSEYLGKLISK